MAKPASKPQGDYLTTLKDGRRIGWKFYRSEDKEEVKRLVQEHFQREPLALALRTPADVYERYADCYANACVDNGLSLLAYDMDRNSICAAMLQSGPYHNGDVPTYARDSEFKEANQLNELMNHVAEKIKDHAKKRPFIFGELVVVHADYAGNHIFQHLAAKFIEKLGYKLSNYVFYSIYTSHYSAQVNEGNQHKCIYQVDYAEYVDPISGQRIFANIPAPHRSAKLLSSL